MFTIDTDASRDLIRAKMWGFLDVAHVDEFFVQEQRAARNLGCGSGRFLVLLDTVDAVIQSQQVVAAFMQHIMTVPLKARRVAVVRSNTLARMQTQRILQVRDQAGIFATLAEAESWLFIPAEDVQRRA